jgi:hypothetical protein
LAFLFVDLFSYLFSIEFIYFLICMLCSDIVSIKDYTEWKFSIMKGQLIGKYMDGSSGVYKKFFSGGGGGSTNSVEDRGQKERGSGGGSPLVRGSTQFANE